MKKFNKRFFIIIIILIFLLLLGFFILLHKEKNNEKYIHISVDDTIQVFRDLTYNKETYDSIYDNKTFKFMKEMHERFGTVFSMYCFLEYEDFSLEDCTDKFKNDFYEARDWIKFGFHSKSGKNDLDTISIEEMQDNYNKVINHLIRITGSSESIDIVPRLHYFAGTRENIDAVNYLENGIDGLLTADDERKSYYLSDENSNFIADNDYFNDNENNMMFISTDLRLENTNNPYTDLVSISNDSKQNKVIEVFTHEWLFGKKMKLKIFATCFWAYKYGYTWDYPMYRI